LHVLVGQFHSNGCDLIGWLVDGERRKEFADLRPEVLRRHPTISGEVL
jgi:hypothetical protein